MKHTLRRQYQQLRRNLSPDQRSHLSQQAVTHLLNSVLWKQSYTIMAYLALPQELSLDAVYSCGWQLHKDMVIPISQPQDHSLLLSRLERFETLSEGAYGIRELPVNCRQPIEVENIDLCLIPGVAFDHYGNRLGFGAGYYDRFLPHLRTDAVKIGVAFSLQISDISLPTDQYDRPMDYLLTEQGLFKISSR